MDGTSYGSVDKFTTSALPVLSGLRVTPGSFRSGASATITYSDSLPARTQFLVLRCVTQKRGKCVRTSRAGSFAHADKQGRNRVPLSGRGLRRGSYVLDATPHALRVGQTVFVRFTIT